MQPDKHYIRMKAMAIAVIAALIIIRIAAHGWGRSGCDGGLCAFELIGPFFLGLISFFVVFIIALNILNKD